MKNIDAHRLTNPLYIRYMLNMDNDIVFSSILEIYNQQTSFEKRNQMTIQKNGRGFRINHARLGSRFAEMIKNKEEFSVNELNDAREMIMHYCAQLAEINKEKIELIELKVQNELRDLDSNLGCFRSRKFTRRFACPMNFVVLAA